MPGMNDASVPSARCHICQYGNSPTGNGVHDPVTAFTQYQSAELIEAIAYGGIAPEDDPLWHHSGAESPAEYSFWSRRSCGMTCLQMVLQHCGRNVPPVQHLMREAISREVYLPRPDGSVLGMLYAPFLEYIRDVHDLDGVVHTDLSLTKLSEELGLGRMVIASVHKEIRRPEFPSPGRRGHLVLVIGRDTRGLHFRNPSGHTHEARYGVLSEEVFGSYFAGRGVALQVA